MHKETPRAHEFDSGPKKPFEAKTILGKMLERIAPRINATVQFEPWGYAGMITFENGKRAFFRGSSIGLNTIASADIAKDKDFANYFMKAMGYRTIPTEKFYSPSWAEAIDSDQSFESAIEYAHSVGFPLIVKPNSGSQGRGVARVNNELELRRALTTVFEGDRVALIQELVTGQDYRIVVLDDRIISAYERIPLNVTGDGTHTISELLELKQAEFIRNGRDTILNPADPRIAETLALKRYTLDTTPTEGEKVYLLSNANLSSGGDAVDVTERVPEDVRELCISLTRDMGLKLCGVDLMLKNGMDGGASGYHVLEINAAPGLDHYATIGEKQDQIVEGLYLEVLKSLANG